MPFRERLKKTFSRGSSSGTNSEDSSTYSESHGKNKHLYYQPGEKIPQKYRRPVDKAHKEKLESFSFASAWRRKSHQSVYSPMGSRMPSRKNSVEVQTGRRSMHTRRGNSFALGADEEDSNIDNVRLSRQVTADRPISRQGANGHLLPPTSAHGFARPRSSDSSRRDTPFSAEDLTLAIKRSHLGVPA